jgi:hypothetical protein
MKKLFLALIIVVFTAFCGGYGGGACGVRSGSMGAAGGGAVLGHQNHEH